MSKKVTSAQDKKNETPNPKVSAKAKENAPADPPEQSAAKTTASKDKKTATPPKGKSDTTDLSGKALAASLVATDGSLPKSWRESFSQRVHGASDQEIEGLREEFHEVIVAQHEGAAPIAEVFQTEKKEKREYHYLLSLAASSSGFDPKTKEKLSKATLTGNRDAFLNILDQAILKDKPEWAKIDQALA